MNKNCWIFFMLLIGGCSDFKKPLLVVENEVVDLGKLTTSDTVTTSFKIFNKGSDTLRIVNIGIECGCTIAKIDKKLLTVGDSTFIHIRYSPKEDRGPVSKSIIIETNSPNPFKALRIIGVVDITLNDRIVY